MALCGEFPADQLYRLIPSSSYAEKVITQLKSEKLLRVHYRDKLRGYRLTKRSKEYLLQEAPKRFALYLTGNADTNQIRSEKSRRLRLHLRAEGYLTLFHAGIPVFLMRSRICFSPAIKPVSGMCEAIHCSIPQEKSNDWEMIQQKSVIHGAWESCSRQNASLQSIIPGTP